MITKDSSVFDAVVDLEATIKANEYIFQIKRQHFLELELRDEQIKKLEQKLKERDNAIEELKEKLALTEKALELGCEEMIEDLQFDSEDDRHYTLQENIEYFKTMAKKEIKDSE